MNIVNILASKKTIAMLCIALGSSVGLSACMQDMDIRITRFADKSALTVSENTLKTVNRAFYASFTAGDWYYQGAKVSNGTVNAYIQIPQKLDMDTELQEKYLREAICPKADKVELWNTLQHIGLEVHIYTFSKMQSVSARCDNPWQKSA